MKTTKKGFTLIELIVVIAIIGVLAAILVPTMLGYVRKSKISSANSAASSVYKAINSALTELDEEGIDVGGLKIETWNGTQWNCTSGDATDLNSVSGSGLGFDKKVANFFSDITKEKSVKAAIKGGACVAVVCCADKTYTGTYPGGVSTTDTYDQTWVKPTDTTPPVVPNSALKAAIAVAGGKKVSGTTAPTLTSDDKYYDIYNAITAE